MPYVQTDSYFAIARGEMRNQYALEKFGRNSGVGTSLEPVCINGVYRTPQVSGAQKLRVRAGNINDDVLGTGAWSIQLEGLDASGNYLREVIPTNGASAGPLSENDFLRLWSAKVYESGTYSSATSGSHAAAITIEDSGGTAWATLDLLNGFPEGRSQIGAFTVPNGFTGYVKNISLFAESTKPITALFFKRENILQTAQPYSTMEAVLDVGPFEAAIAFPRNVPLGPFPALTDIGFMARAATSSIVDANFTILLDKDPTYAQPKDFLA